jgi:hypothetical protein
LFIIGQLHSEIVPRCAGKETLVDGGQPAPDIVGIGQVMNISADKILKKGI